MPDRPRGGALTSDDRPSAGSWQTRGPVLAPIADVPAQPSRQRGPAARVFKPLSQAMAVTATVSVVIPARNEAPNLPHVFATMPQWVDEVILVDGQSTDDTIAVARRLWPEIRVVRQAGRGKGDALLAGFAASTGDIIVTMDADGSTDGAEIIQFVAALTAGADFAKGSRFANSGGTSDMTATRRYGNRILSSLVNLLFGTRYTDLCYGYNAFWARHLAALALDCAGFEVETMMNIRAAEARLRVQEIPSFEHPRVYGSSNLSITMDGWRIAKVIVREWRRHRHAHRFNSDELRPGEPFGAVIGHDTSVEPAETCVELT
jgi:glycosyltransferase involved in cell wall biosynthesis